MLSLCKEHKRYLIEQIISFESWFYQICSIECAITKNIYKRKKNWLIQFKDMKNFIGGSAAQSKNEEMELTWSSSSHHASTFKLPATYWYLISYSSFGSKNSARSLHKQNWMDRHFSTARGELIFRLHAYTCCKCGLRSSALVWWAWVHEKQNFSFIGRTKLFICAGVLLQLFRVSWKWHNAIIQVSWWWTVKAEFHECLVVV